jgi:predicted acylesterase/phospholipase RssA
MDTIGLSLSGGGFRATLYHLGVVRFLRDAHLLSKTTEIASVSGGSILAAHLALNWHRYNSDDVKDFDAAAKEIIKFTQLDVRNHIVRRIPLQLPLRLISKIPFVDLPTPAPNELLANYYKRFLFGEKCLFELPETPNLNILATSVSTGGLAIFNRDGLWVERREGRNTRTSKKIPGQLARVARVVAASSAFPGFFSPVRFTAADLGVHEGEFPTEYFTDGGVYDNLGVRAFEWLGQNNHGHTRILVSDAGKPFQVLPDASFGFFGQSIRATDILWDRVWQLENENFGDKKGFVFLRMTQNVDLLEDSSALHPLVQTEVQTIRTDLDRFSDQEINVLVQHGYEVARKICRQHGLVEDGAICSEPAWKPIPDKKSVTGKAERSWDSTQPSPIARLSRLIRGSSKRRIFSNFLDRKDWVTYLYLLIGFFIFAVAPFNFYQLYKKAQIQDTIINAIASGDDDIREILNIAISGSPLGWSGHKVDLADTPVPSDLNGVEILTNSRIYDLRNWRPKEEKPESRGRVYIRDRMKLKLTDSYRGDGHITFNAYLPANNISIRHSSTSFPGSIIRIDEKKTQNQQDKSLYQFSYDLSKIPRGEVVNLSLEFLIDAKEQYRAPFKLQAKTDLISVWILFPTHTPYKNYSLLTYPADLSDAPRVMDSRYALDHPYGRFIGWSVASPREDMIYETRWSSE